MTRTGNREHISPVLRELHWLPVKKRIDYKILSLTFLSLQGLSPIYLQSLVQQYNPTRNLRSSSKSQLVCPQTSTKSYGCRAFSAAAAQLWNTIPENIKQAGTVEQFKALLKTHLFLNWLFGLFFVFWLCLCESFLMSKFIYFFLLLSYKRLETCLIVIRAI